MLELLHMQLVFLQTIIVNSTNPCFLNYTSNNIWQDCGMGKDYLAAITIGFQYVTGGYFSLVIAFVVILFTYIKYHKLTYTLFVGTLFIPISYFVFPTQFLNFALIMASFGIATLIYYVLISQTNEQ
jgi:hypothetical protein